MAKILNAWSGAENILSVLQEGCFIRDHHSWRSGNPQYNSLTTCFCSHAYPYKIFSYFTETSREGKKISDFPEDSINWWPQTTCKIPQFWINLGLQFPALAWVLCIESIILFFLGIILEIVSFEQVLAEQISRILFSKGVFSTVNFEQKEIFIEVSFLGRRPQRMAGIWFSLCAQYFLLVISRKLSHNQLTPLKCLAPPVYCPGRFSYLLSGFEFSTEGQAPKM